MKENKKYFLNKLNPQKIMIILCILVFIIGFIIIMIVNKTENEKKHYSELVNVVNEEYKDENVEIKWGEYDEETNFYYYETVDKENSENVKQYAIDSETKKIFQINEFELELPKPEIINEYNF